MPPAAPGSWLAIGTRLGGATAAVVVLLAVGVGAGHLALSTAQALLGGFTAGTRDDAIQVVGTDRGGDWRYRARRGREYAELGRDMADDARRHVFTHRWCRERGPCVKAADATTPQARP